ncbi:ABC transporter permease [Jatrophihabitans fulvus]
MSGVLPAAAPSSHRTRRRRGGTRALTRGAGLGLGVGVLWLSIIVLLPMAALVVAASGEGVAGFWDAVTAPDARSAMTLTVGISLLVTVVNAIMGTVIAWVLVRHDFVGKRLVEVIIDLPFALPTIVAGVVLISLYGPKSPVGISLVGTREGIAVALLFVSLPFVVRSVQPVLIEMDRDVEEAAASLGAGTFTIWRRIVLPAMVPAIVSGSALAFARALGEYGSVILISNNIRGETEVASYYMLRMIENDEKVKYASIATVLLIVALVVLVTLDVLQRRVARRG